MNSLYSPKTWPSPIHKPTDDSRQPVKAEKTQEGWEEGKDFSSQLQPDNFQNTSLQIAMKQLNIIKKLAIQLLIWETNVESHVEKFYFKNSQILTILATPPLYSWFRQVPKSWEMAQGITCYLWYQGEFGSQMPMWKHMRQCWDGGGHRQIPGDPWPASLAKTAVSQISERSFLKKEQCKRTLDTNLWPWLCVYTDAYTHTHANMYRSHIQKDRDITMPHRLSGESLTL